MAFCGAHLEPISQEVLVITICKMSLKNMVVTLPPYLPGANKLNDCIIDPQLVEAPWSTVALHRDSLIIKGLCGI